MESGPYSPATSQLHSTLCDGLPAWSSLLHQELVLFLGKRDQIVQLGQINREWFFTQYVLSTGKSTFSILIMEIMGCSDIDRIDILTFSCLLFVYGEMSTYRSVIDLFV
jgi:hypothetical protein